MDGARTISHNQYNGYWERREGGRGKGRRKGGEVLGKDLETLEALDAASKNVKWHSLYGK